MQDFFLLQGKKQYILTESDHIPGVYHLGMGH